VKGGEIAAEGTPEDVVKVELSFTGKYLAPLLRGRREGHRETGGCGGGARASYLPCA